MVLSVCCNAVVLTSYPSFCFNACANVLANDDDEKKICKLNFHSATHDLSRTCLKALLLELAKIKEELREALPVCKPF